MTKQIGWISGKFCEEESLLISAKNANFLRGYGLFEHFRTYSKTPFRLEARLRRIRGAASFLSIPIKETDEEIRFIIEQLIEKHPAKEDLRIHLVASGGETSYGFYPEPHASLIILVDELDPRAYDYSSGIEAISTSYARSFGHIKTVQYVSAILALKEAKAKGAKEALYLDGSGGIYEGTTCNFFGVHKGELITSNSPHILPGITRAALLEIAKGRYPIRFENFPLREITTLDEAFTSSSIKHIVPLLSIDKTPIGEGTVGPITKQLMGLLQELIAKETRPTLASIRQ